MIGLGLRLALRGGREAAARLVATAAAVALGVGLLLATAAAVHGVAAQNSRYAWLNSGNPAATAADAVPSPDPAWARVGTDFYAGERITRVDVAATGPRSPVPPGLPRLPGPGEYYASPALGALLRAAPAAELGGRYPGRRAGTIGAAALPAPDALIVVVGRDADELSRVPGAARVTSIATRDPGECRGCRYGIGSDGMTLVLAVTAAALIFPVLVFIGTATRLSAARREQRFAAMRLVGATPRQVSALAAVEATVAAGAGTAAGFGLFSLLRVPLAAVPLTGAPFYPGDLSLRPVDALVVAVGVPLAAAAAARIALRRVRISPLGVSRRVTPRPPRAVRLAPLAAGIGVLGYFVGRRPETTNGQTVAYLSGIFLMMLGLVVAGPWLTMVGARVLARRTGRPAALVAGRRLADDPKAGFRAVSGLVLALFATSTAVGVMTTMIAERGVPTGDAAAVAALTVDFADGWTEAGAPAGSVPPVPAPVLARLRAVPGTGGVVQVHANPLGTQVRVGDWTQLAGLVSCAEFGTVPGFGRCPAGAEVASVPRVLGAVDRSAAEWTATVWPAAAMGADRLRRLPVQALLVGTDGSPGGLERTRTALATAFPDRGAPITVAEARADSGIAQQLAGFQQLATVVIVVSLCIAGCSLAASVVAGLNDRRRPFSLLRLTGVPVRLLRRVVVLESAVPLLIVAVIAVGAGFLAAGLFLRSQLDYSLRPPGTGYYLTVLAGLVAALGVIGATLPLLDRVTGPETASNE